MKVTIEKFDLNPAFRERVMIFFGFTMVLTCVHDEAGKIKMSYGLEKTMHRRWAWLFFGYRKGKEGGE